jgi:hypothetical protein
MAHRAIPRRRAWGGAISAASFFFSLAISILEIELGALQIARPAQIILSVAVR